MNCKRCNGFVCEEPEMSPDSGTEPILFYRCINCGNYFDLIIISNRLKKQGRVRGSNGRYARKSKPSYVVDYSTTLNDNNKRFILKSRDIDYDFRLEEPMGVFGVHHYG